MGLFSSLASLMHMVYIRVVKNIKRRGYYQRRGAVMEHGTGTHLPSHEICSGQDFPLERGLFPHTHACSRGNHSTDPPACGDHQPDSVQHESDLPKYEKIVGQADTDISKYGYYKVILPQHDANPPKHAAVPE